MKTVQEGVPTGSTWPRRAYGALGVQLLLFATLVGVSFANELLDLPHYLLGSAPTSFDQRWGEVIIEGLTFAMVIGIEIGLLQRLRREIRVLRGILPVCMHCKSIRHEGRWVPMETYITHHSMAHFSHGVCPECLVRHYPEAVPSLSASSQSLPAPFPEPSPPFLGAKH